MMSHDKEAYPTCEVVNLPVDLTKYVEDRLLHWAEWYNRGCSYVLGYPSRSVEYSFLSDGQVNKSTKSYVLPSDTDAEEIESYIVEMNKQNKFMAEIIRHNYLNPGSLRIKAENFSRNNFKISYGRYKDYVDMGHQWLAGCFTAKKHKF